MVGRVICDGDWQIGVTYDANQYWYALHVNEFLFQFGGISRALYRGDENSLLHLDIFSQPNDGSKPTMMLIRLAAMVGSWHQDPEGEGPRRSRRRAESLPA
eukprot:SAG31_NODE_873_length_11325_cov_34.061197_6_plen_101_part_00